MPLALQLVETDSEPLHGLPATEITDALHMVPCISAGGVVPSLDEYEDFKVPGGYDQVAVIVAEGLDIRTNVVVHAVRSSSDGVEIDTDGQTFSARAVVVAVPVGVLQALGSLTGETLGPPPSRHDNPRLGRHPFGRGAYAGPEPLPHGLFVRWMSKSFGQAWSPGPSMNPQPLGGMPA